MTDLSGMHNYTYDDVYQLIQATHPNQATPPSIPMEQFTYDAVGNRISAEGVIVATPVATSYTHYFGSRLTKVEYPSTVARCRYDPLGGRIENFDTPLSGKSPFTSANCLRNRKES